MKELIKEICFEVSKICKIDIDLVYKNKTQSFFDEPFYFTPEKLVYLYFYVKEKYKIVFSKQEMINYNFLNIESLCRSIEENI